MENYSTHWSITKNKTLELEVGHAPGSWFTFFRFIFTTHSFGVNIFGIEFDAKWRTDHSGIDVSYMFPTKHFIEFRFYDNRHAEHRWQK